MDTKLLNIQRRILLGLLLLAGAVVLGILGYMLIEHYTFLEAFYMTVITLATIGYGEVKPLDDAGRIFTIILIFATLGSFTYFITLFSSHIIDGEYRKLYKLHKMKEKILKLSRHVIICGYGRNGREAASLMAQQNVDFVVIERDGIILEEKGAEVKYFLEADATKDPVLHEAGIENARALITTLPDDADNLFVVLTGKEMNPEVKIISRASQDSSVKKLKMAGATNVIMPDKIGGAHMASLILNPDIKEFIDYMSAPRKNEVSITELTLQKTISIKELNCWNRSGATLLGIKNKSGDFLLSPSPESTALADDKLIIMGNEQQIAKAKELINT